jgi:hypothetical protein
VTLAGDKLPGEVKMTFLGNAKLAGERMNE